MLWRGLMGPLDKWRLYAVILTLGTGLQLLFNNGECVFQTWAELISGEEIVSDIFLPPAAARLIVPISTPLVALGLVLMGTRWLSERRRES